MFSNMILIEKTNLRNFTKVLHCTVSRALSSWYWLSALRNVNRSTASSSRSVSKGLLVKRLFEINCKLKPKNRAKKIIPTYPQRLWKNLKSFSERVFQSFMRTRRFWLESLWRRKLCWVTHRRKVNDDTKLQSGFFKEDKYLLP